MYYPFQFGWLRRTVKSKSSFKSQTIVKSEERKDENDNLIRDKDGKAKATVRSGSINVQIDALFKRLEKIYGP